MGVSGRLLGTQGSIIPEKKFKEQRTKSAHRCAPQKATRKIDWGYLSFSVAPLALVKILSP